MGQVEQTPDPIVQIEEHRSIVDSLERDIGRYDQRLVEPLLRLAEATMELDQFDETDSILDRAIQISRLNEGLYTDSQVPLLILSVKNDARRGDWRDARGTLEHLAWFYRQKYEAPLEDWLTQVLELVDLHLEGFVHDHPDNKSFHFRAASSLTWTAIRVAERAWEPADPRLAQLYYRQARHYYLEATAIERGGRTSYELREIPLQMMRIGYDFQDAYLGNAFSQGSVISRKNSNRQSFRMGIGLLRRMEEVFRRAESPDLEAIAMVDLYLADWMVMFDERDSASRYGIAFDNLREVGVPSQQLNRFFAVPQILPRTEFYPSVEEAMQAIEIANLPMVDAERSAEPEVRSDIRFEEWSPGFPNFPTQVLSATLLPEEIEDYETVHLSIRLRGLEKVSRWVSGRYISQISVPDQFEIIEPSQQYAMDLEELAVRMHFLTFRPRLVDGVAQPFEGTLSYRYFTDWNQ